MATWESETSGAEVCALKHLCFEVHLNTAHPKKIASRSELCKRKSFLTGKILLSVRNPRATAKRVRYTKTVAWVERVGLRWSILCESRVKCKIPRANRGGCETFNVCSSSWYAITTVIIGGAHFEPQKGSKRKAMPVDQPCKKGIMMIFYLIKTKQKSLPVASRKCLLVARATHMKPAKLIVT